MRPAVATLVLVAVALLGGTKEAQANGVVIEQPGQHREYAVELEPQLVLRYSSPYRRYWYDGRGRDDYYWRSSAGFGPGLRVAIPFMHQGPINSINNNIGISFGASTTFHGCYCDAGYRATVFNVPMAFQWNFYFTEIFSAFGEVGLNSAIAFYSEPVRRNTQFFMDPLFQVGGRAQFGTVGIVARVGWPFMSVGANFQF